jgi:Zn-dependent M28 family amino/carboxypeptidase
MKRYLGLLPHIVFLSVFSLNGRASSATTVDIPRLKADVHALTSTSQPRDFTNRVGTQEAVSYIQSEFAKVTNDIEIQTYQIKHGLEFKNIIASFGPRDAPRIIIGAHYDVCQQFPGADDNASGVAGILELARLLKARNSNLKYRIDLVAYGTEEPPFFASKNMGSFHHASKLKEAKVRVKLMLALDGIGFFSSKENSQSYPFPLNWIYPSTGNFIAVVSHWKDSSLTVEVKDLMIEGSNGLAVERVNLPAFVRGGDFSDHRNFWKHKYPGVMITDTAFYRNPNYHRASDTIDTLDFSQMGKVVAGILNVVLKIQL